MELKPFRVVCLIFSLGLAGLGLLVFFAILLWLWVYDSFSSMEASSRTTSVLQKSTENDLFFCYVSNSNSNFTEC